MEHIVLAQEQLDTENPIKAFHVIGEDTKPESLNASDWNIESTYRIVAVIEVENFEGEVYLGGVIVPVAYIDLAAIDSGE